MIEPDRPLHAPHQSSSLPSYDLLNSWTTILKVCIELHLQENPSMVITSTTRPNRLVCNTPNLEITNKVSASAMATSLSVGAAERTVSVLKWRRKRRRRVLDLFQGPIPFHKAVLHLLVWPYHPTMPSQSSHNLLSPNASSTASKQCNKQVQERTKLLKFIHSAFMELIGIQLIICKPN